MSGYISLCLSLSSCASTVLRYSDHLYVLDALFPIVTSLGQAIRLHVHPLYLMIPGTVGCSYAFMLPVSTPPNSIAFASGHLLVKDMVSVGLPSSGLARGRVSGGPEEPAWPVYSTAPLDAETSETETLFFLLLTSSSPSILFFLYSPFSLNFSSSSSSVPSHHHPMHPQLTQLRPDYGTRHETPTG